MNWWSWLATGLGGTPQELVGNMVSSWQEDPEQFAGLRNFYNKWQLRRNSLETLGLATWAIAQNVSGVEIVPTEAIPFFAFALGAKVWLQSLIVDKTNAAVLEQIQQLRESPTEADAMNSLEPLLQ